MGKTTAGSKSSLTSIFYKIKRHFAHSLFGLMSYRNIKSTIISNDCWGGEIYKVCNTEYLTPFVGLMIMAPDYLKLLENFKYFMESELEFINRSKYDKFASVQYPIGILGNEIEIHFMHYISEEDVISKWNRRKERINWDNLYFKFDCSKDYADESHILKFENLEFKNKLCIGDKNYNYNSCLYIPEWNENAVKMVYRTYKYYNIFKWVLNKPAKLSLFDRLIYRLFLKQI